MLYFVIAVKTMSECMVVYGPHAFGESDYEEVLLILWIYIYK